MPNDNGEGKCKSFWEYINRAKVLIPVITGIIAILVIIYKIDCYNINTYGDTVFAKDVDVSQLKKQINLEQSIRRAHSKLERYKEERRSNQRWLDAVREKYPIKTDMPPETLKDYKKTKDRNEKLVKKIDKWEKKLEELEDKELE